MVFSETFEYFVRSPKHMPYQLQNILSVSDHCLKIERKHLVLVFGQLTCFPLIYIKKNSTIVRLEADVFQFVKWRRLIKLAFYKLEDISSSFNKLKLGSK